MKLLTADLHLDSDSLNEYRWGIFPFLKEVVKELSIKQLYILGDLTEKKDKHSSQLVNRFIEEISALSFDFDLEIFILKGNHDYVDEKTPFFDFITLSNNNINFISEIALIKDELFIPHMKNFKLPDVNYDKIKRIYIHQPFIGAVAQNNFIMDKGENLETIKSIKAKIFSGDIHTPQQLGNLIYVGSPYSVYFGDAFEGRILILDDKDEIHEINPGFIKKLSITINHLDELTDYKIRPEDQVKVKMILDKSDIGLWGGLKKDIKNYIDRIGGVLVSLEMKQSANQDSIEIANIESKSDLVILKEYAKKENLDMDFINKGEKIING